MPEGVVYHDLGHKPSNPEGASPASPPQKYYPMAHSLDLDQLPELDIYDAGDTVTVVFRAHIRGKEVRKVEGEKEKTTFDLELREGGIYDEGKAKKRRETGQSKEQQEKAK